MTSFFTRLHGQKAVITKTHFLAGRVPTSGDPRPTSQDPIRFPTSPPVWFILSENERKNRDFESTLFQTLLSSLSPSSSPSSPPRLASPPPPHRRNCKRVLWEQSNPADSLPSFTGLAFLDGRKRGSLYRVHTHGRTDRRPSRSPPPPSTTTKPSSTRREIFLQIQKSSHNYRLLGSIALPQSSFPHRCGACLRLPKTGDREVDP